MRLTPGHRRWVYASAAALFASGLLWLVYHYFLRVHGEFGDTPRPLEHWWLRVHGAAAMVFLIVVGSLLPIHIRRGWHQRRNLGLGIALTTLALLLTASGYALYYFGGEETRPLLSIAHWVIGLGAPLLFVWHVVNGRALARAKTAADHGDPPRATLVESWPSTSTTPQSNGPSASA